jgi:hypothetical protein
MLSWEKGILQEKHNKISPGLGKMPEKANGADVG